ncbi:hypothetical protein ACFXJ8_02830 [Nonomuraea sp. NPDC059194]|uniref:hypothetical protein n=1 Tax=Nonomuraea sp. NPDC059194 TaxID=3346764 RepID=UPI003674E7C3
MSDALREFFRQPQAYRQAVGVRALDRYPAYELGKAAATADAVLKTLSWRSVAVSEQARGRILACRNLEQLDVWFDRAFDVVTVDELFD